MTTTVNKEMRKASAPSLASLVGLGLFTLAAVAGYGPTGGLSILALICLATAEVVGRRHFYKLYSRLGL